MPAIKGKHIFMQDTWSNLMSPKIEVFSVLTHLNLKVILWSVPLKFTYHTIMNLFAHSTDLPNDKYMLMQDTGLMSPRSEFFPVFTNLNLNVICFFGFDP